MQSSTERLEGRPLQGTATVGRAKDSGSIRFDYGLCFHGFTVLLEWLGLMRELVNSLNCVFHQG